MSVQLGLILREGHRLKVPENRVLRYMSEPKNRVLRYMSEPKNRVLRYMSEPKNRVLRYMSEPKKEDVTGDWRKLHTEKLYDL